jgi:hypothetical protein
MNMKTLATVAALSLLAGCANLGGVDCGPDWYAIGQRDGRIGAQPQDAAYAQRCGAVDAARYREGWQDGFSARPRPVV